MGVNEDKQGKLLFPKDPYGNKLIAVPSAFSFHVSISGFVICDCDFFWGGRDFVDYDLSQ